MSKTTETNYCNCSSGKHNIETGTKFIQPTLLLLLKQKPNHGYGLLDDVKAFGFYDSDPDISVIYRNLKKIKTDGLVETTWETTESGPAKKVYELTEAGEEKLKEYVDFFENRKKLLEKFIQNYQNAKG